MTSGPTSVRPPADLAVLAGQDLNGTSPIPPPGETLVEPRRDHAVGELKVRQSAHIRPLPRRGFAPAPAPRRTSPPRAIASLVRGPPPSPPVLDGQPTSASGCPRSHPAPRSPAPASIASRPPTIRTRDRIPARSCADRRSPVPSRSPPTTASPTIFSSPFRWARGPRRRSAGCRETRSAGRHRTVNGFAGLPQSRRSVPAE